MDQYEISLRKLTRDPRIRRMKQYQQHTISNTFDHVCHVARMSRKIQKKLRLSLSEAELLRGAMLHDYYLYNFRENPIGPYAHGTSHAQIAAENADRDFHLTEKEKQIILSHMWPLNLTRIPRCREAWVVTAADKICAFQEMILHRHFDEDLHEDSDITAL
ncbi:MAG: HD domain-containing protein [Lachnospiraceae bacterium]|nr:HD domain-containing protein [Lachnospiraceae bacterium]